MMIKVTNSLGKHIEGIVRDEALFSSVGTVSGSLLVERCFTEKCNYCATNTCVGHERNFDTLVDNLETL